MSSWPQHLLFLSRCSSTVTDLTMDPTIMDPTMGPTTDPTTDPIMDPTTLDPIIIRSTSTEIGTSTVIAWVGIVEDLGEAATVVPTAGVSEAAGFRIPSRLRRGEGAIGPLPLTIPANSLAKTGAKSDTGKILDVQTSRQP